MDALFEPQPCSSRVPDEVDEMITDGRSGATVIEQTGTPDESIDSAVAAFCKSGWTWDSRNLTRDGWLAWFRSQGNLAPPIVQWARLWQAQERL